MGSIYTHGNGLSTLMLPVIPSLVSHVGFNNLNRWNTSSSSFSETLSTTATVNSQSKSVATLARLFTLNRSDVLLQESVSDDAESISTLEPKKKLLLLKRSTTKFKLKKASKKPDLSVQTGGHHGIRIPKKILSSSQEDSNSSTFEVASASLGRKVSGTTSPGLTLHNFFHRSHHHHHHAKIEAFTARQSLETAVESPPQTVTVANNPNRTALGLSLQSSNLFITDVQFAMVYKFTDPNYVATMGQGDKIDSTGVLKSASFNGLSSVNTSVNGGNSIGGGIGGGTNDGTFSDFTRKMKMPADQYFQQKLGRNQNHDDHPAITRNDLLQYLTGFLTSGVSGLGLGIYASDMELYFQGYLFDFSKLNSPLFVGLLATLQPLALHSKETTLSSGTKHAYIGLAIDDVAVYIDDVFYRRLNQAWSFAGSPTAVTTGGGSNGGSGGGSGAGGSGHSKAGLAANSGANSSVYHSGSRKTRSHRSGSNTATISSSAGSGFDIRDSELHDFKGQVDRDGDGNEVQVDDLQIRELHQDLVTFCFRLVSQLERDKVWNKIKDSEIKEWQVLCDRWKFFNERIRFQVCGIFHSIERHFGEYASRNAPAIHIDSIVLLAFRDAIIIPLLYRSKKGTVLTNEYKKKLLEGGILGNIQECFGVIDAMTVDEPGNGDGDNFNRTRIFRQITSNVLEKMA